MDIPLPSTAPTASARPIIVVTGANSGVGFGTCQRLLLQLCNPTPTDTLPHHPDLTFNNKSCYSSTTTSSTTAPPTTPTPTPSPFSAPNGCTLLLACRNPIKAHKAVKQLQILLDNLESMDDDQELPKSTPSNDFFRDSNLDYRDFGPVDEDSDAAVIAQAQEASLKRRKNRFNGVLEKQKAENENEDEGGDKKRTPLQEHSYRERKARGDYRRNFCRGTKIEFVALDLGSMASALSCAKEITER